MSRSDVYCQNATDGIRSNSVLWFYEKDREKVEVETRFDNGSLEYVVAVRWPDGRATTERFADAFAFQNRLLALEQQLASDSWRSTGMPMVLPDGWPDKRPPR